MRRSKRQNLVSLSKELDRSRSGIEKFESRYQAATKRAHDTFYDGAEYIGNYVFEREKDPQEMSSLSALVSNLKRLSPAQNFAVMVNEANRVLDKYKMETSSVRKKTRRKPKRVVDYDAYFDRVKSGRYSDERANRVLDKLGVKGKLRGTYKGLFMRYRNNR